MVQENKKKHQLSSLTEVCNQSTKEVLVSYSTYTMCLCYTYIQ